MPFCAFDHYDEFTLANGQHVISFEIPHANVQDVHISLNAGHSHSHNGLSHYTEHIVAHAEDSGEANKLRQELEEYGGNWYGGSTYLKRCIYGFALPLERIDKFPEILNRLGRYVFGSTLRHNEEIEKGIFEVEFNKIFGSLITQQLDQIEALCYFNEYYHGMMQRFGDIQTIQSRPFEVVKKFYNSHYVPANSTIITAGPLSVDDIKAYLEKSTLPHFPQGTAPTLDETGISNTPNAQERRYAFEYPNSTSASYKNQRNLDKSHTPFEIEMARRALYRITKDALREDEGLVYSVNAFSYQIPGGFTLGFSISGLSVDNIEAFQDKLAEAWQRIESEELDDVLEQIKTARSSQIRAQELLTPAVVKKAAQHLSDYKRILTNEEYIEGLQGVSADRVRSILETLNPEHKHYQRWLLPPGTPTPRGYVVTTMDKTLESLKQEVGA